MSFHSGFHASLDQATGHRIIALRQAIIANFSAEQWHEVGLLTGQSQLIRGHDRLLRSLSFGDDDYSGNVLSVLQNIAERSPDSLAIIERYVNERYNDRSEYISSEPSARRVSFAPSVFAIPEGTLENDLVAVMMPINAAFSQVYTAVQRACELANLRCLRADNIWESSAIIQDIFSLIFRAQTVVVDFSERNANVMYETGIAHTLGKTVVPICQSMTDIPFDLHHHRALMYLNNGEGLTEMQNRLHARLLQVSSGSH